MTKHDGNDFWFNAWLRSVTETKEEKAARLAEYAAQDAAWLAKARAAMRDYEEP